LGVVARQRRRIVCVALTLACASVCATPSLAAARLKVVYREDRGVLQPGSTDGFSERCPAAAPHAIAGYFGTDSPSTSPLVSLADSVPFGKAGRAWSIGVKNLSPDPQAYFVGAVCASSGPYVRVSNSGTVAPGQTDGYDVTCPRRAPNPISGWFSPTAQNTGQLMLVASDPSGRGWTISVKNASDQPQAYAAGAICAGPKVKVSYLGSQQRTVQPATIDYVGGQCPRRTPHAVDGAFGIPTSSDFGNVSIGGSTWTGTTGRSWEIGVINLAPDPQPYFAGMVCIG
jgi:hypothetical protein